MRTADADQRPDAPQEPAGLSVAEGALENGGCVLTVHGELDIATTPALRERLSQIIERGVRLLVVDLRAVSFMDSTALAIFIRVRTRLGRDGRMTLVTAPDSYARLILDIAGLARALDVVETLDEGIQHVDA